MSTSSHESVASSGPSRGERATDTSDSLLFCLQSIARRHELPASRDALLAGLPLVSGRLTMALLPRAAARARLKLRWLARRVADLDDSMAPAIVILKDGDACLFMGRCQDPMSIRIRNPAVGDMDVEVPVADVTERQTGYVALAEPEFQFDERVATGGAAPGHWFWGAMRARVPMYRDVMWAGLLVNLMALAIPLYTMNVYDRVVPNRAIETLWALSIGAVLVLVFDLVLRTLRAKVLDAAGSQVDLSLSRTIMERVLDTRLAARPKSVGSFAANLRSFESVRDFVTSASLAAFVDLPFAIIFLLMIGWIAPVLALPVLVAVVVVIAITLPVQARMRELAASSANAAAQRNATLVEALSGFETVKALGLEGRMQARWEQAAEFVAGVSAKLRLLGSSTTHMVSCVQQVVTVATVVLGVHLIAENQLTLGGLIAVGMLGGRVLAPLAQLAGLMTQYHSAATSLKSLNDVMNQPVERPAGMRFVERQHVAGTIEFRDVSFRYPGQDNGALQGVNLRIEAGDRVGIIGRTGSGKSSLHRLILGLYQPDEGSVLIDGIDTRQWDPAQLRRQVGYVPQDATLMYGTLRDNIAMGDAQVSDQQVIRAAAVADLADFVNSHSKGFDLVIGERGETLSGGQRKAVGLARGLVGDRPILLLDEPTESMDHTTEERIRTRLKDHLQNRTLLLVTHRTSLLELVDKLIVLDGGRVVSAGPKEQVLESLRGGRVLKAA